MAFGLAAGDSYAVSMGCAAAGVCCGASRTRVVLYAARCACGTATTGGASNSTDSGADTGTCGS
jgi:hypothetical protein